jgi:uncharacterized membrane protein SpoIIM required for sporulation/uncharacterized RDD family membrane protein YckC
MTAGHSPVDLRPRHEVETPEHVTLRYEVAGLGSRAIAAVVDHAIILLFLTGLGTAGDLLPGGDLVRLVGGFLVSWGYFTGFESWWQGRTPGKRWSGLRVVLDDGRPVGFEGAALRNLLRIADFMLPPPYIAGMVAIFFHPRAKRLGDMVAGTLVVRDTPEPAPGRVVPAPIRPASSLTAPSLTARLTPDEYEVLGEFIARTEGLEFEAAMRLAAGLTIRFAARFPDRPKDPLEFLRRLYHDEQDRRAAGRGGTAGEMAALKLAARQERRWAEFGVLADLAARRGLDSFSAHQLPDFAARYREVAADLARLRTYRAPAALLARIERLAATGHNALYRGAERPWQRLGPILLRESPAAVVRSWRPIAVAIALLVATSVAGYATLRERPALAEQVIPPVMLERAAAARERTAEGLTYVEAESDEAPVLAGMLMTNNIGVAFRCFAGGILFGVGSLFILASNGLSLGSTFGHFVNVGAGWYLGSFILGHGLIELFAICVAAAAGFRLGRALWSPGDLTRGDALRLEGRLALRMLGAVVVLLMLAGTIEGLASATGASFAYRAGLASASAVFLVLYLVNGARWAATIDAP